MGLSRLLLICILTVLPSCSRTDHPYSAILLDGDFDDWQHPQMTLSDPSDDAREGVDLKRVLLAQDRDYLYLSIEIDQETVLQDNNLITLDFDSDNNPATGRVMDGMGIDWSYSPGLRKGRFYGAGQSFDLEVGAVGIYMAPTVSATRFELAFTKSTQVNGKPLFASDQLRLRIRDQREAGDRIPDQGPSPVFQLKTCAPRHMPEWSMSTAPNHHLRLLTYNVARNRLFLPETKQAYTRIIQALQPDLIAFQEIVDRTSSEVMTAIETMLPKGRWHHAYSNGDVMLFSRYPIINIAPLSDNTAFLVDTNLPDDKKLLVVVASLPCCDRDLKRQEQVDEIMELVQNSRQQTGPLPLVKDSPIIITGDMNLVGWSQQLHTLLNGTSQAPDWDNTAFTDARPFTTGLPMTFTWHHPTMDYPPGRLDFVLYADSALQVTNSFTLFTPALSAEQLTRYHLASDDTTLASDHLPVVVDFSLKY